ncbi:MAG: MBL fold metallo-hydrolase [Lachnospiraceae bacterium]|nr:MBL fold metallo-hydrolase [Lachnospiraceae bacterium]
MEQKLYVFGTGNAAVTKCYNTCFALSDGEELFLVDAGGGNGILTQFEKMNVSVNQIHHMFVTHKHTDHILGAVWIVRMVATQMHKGNYKGDFRIYGHKEVVAMLRSFCDMMLAKKHVAFLDERIFFDEVTEGQTVEILSYSVTFFDIFSTKAKQFGFTTTLRDGSALTFTGDEPYNEACEKFVIGSTWLLHEAFCLDEDKDVFEPYEKHHGTAMDAGRTAQELMAEKVVLWHTEDKTLATRKQKYTKEAKQVFDGEVFVPDDMEIICLF